MSSESSHRREAAAVRRDIRIIEVGPRDGLQNESRPVPTATKIRFVNALSSAGFPEIEVSSFVHPKLVPQLADATEVFAGLEPAEGTVYSALVPNEKGLARALESGVRRIAVFTAASETFNRKNINAGIDESIERFTPVLDLAKDAGVSVRGYVSTAFFCPFEGEIPPEAVVRVVDRLFELGVDEVSIGDTIGAALPSHVERLIGVLTPPLDRIAMHFHDTRGTALVNVMASLEYGIRTFDASAGGLGGCPFAPGATGNLATEDLLFFLHGIGIETGVDAAAVTRASDIMEEAFGSPLPSRVRNAGAIVKGSSDGDGDGDA